MMQVEGYNETDFRDTDIGPLPTAWETVTIGSICRCKGGYSFPPFLQGKASGRYPFYKVSDMNLSQNEKVMSIANNYVSAEVLQELKGTPFRKGSVIFPKVGAAIHTNKKRILGRDAAVDNNVMAVWVEDQQQCTDDFLYFCFLTIDLSDLANVGTLPSITNARVNNRKIPLPPLPEQRRIAAVLNAIQDEIAAQDDIIAAARGLKRSLMQRLFTYGPGSEPAETKETEIGEIPAHWEVARLGDITQLQSGGTPSRKNPSFYENGTIPWVKTLDLSGGHLTFTDEMISSEALTSIRGRIRPIGTVMIAMYGGAGTIGKSGILAIEAATNQAICCIHPNNVRFITEYLHYYIVMLRPRWMKYATGTRKDPNISKTTIENELIPLPPIIEQSRITEYLGAVDDKIVNEEDRKAGLQDVFTTMLHQLMAGQMRLLTDEGIPGVNA